MDKSSEQRIQKAWRLFQEKLSAIKQKALKQASTKQQINDEDELKKLREKL